MGKKNCSYYIARAGTDNKLLNVDLLKCETERKRKWTDERN